VNFPNFRNGTSPCGQTFVKSNRFQLQFVSK
jgi:hypothetical protein